MNEKNKYKTIRTGSTVTLVAAVSFAMFTGGCQNGCNHSAPVPATDTTKTQPTQTNSLPSFNPDSAYKYTKEQVDFGPRIPGTKAHEKCLQFIIDKLKSEGLTVSVQKSTTKTFDGKTFDFENVTASSQPNNARRILLCTHWDTRPFADADSVDPKGTFDGAVDGASGVATLLEIGRHLNEIKASVGVDLVFFDIEDYGQQGPEDGPYPEMKDSWCLGSQYWAKNLPPNYAPIYGILLDMVGGKNATFPMEGTGMHFAPDVVKKIWDKAAKLGYSSYFTNDGTGMTTDDHLYINEIANIPTIDIVDYEVSRGDYPYWHHKHSDNMSQVDTASLHIVGRVLINVISQE